MRNCYFFLALFLVSTFLCAQELSIDFEDHKLENWYSPDMDHWMISNAQPIAGKLCLHHAFDSPESSEDWIGYYHAPVISGAAEQSWEFSLRYDFKPSANNCWAVILGNNYALSNGKLENALILGVNYEDSDDMIKIWQKTGDETKTVINSGINWEEEVDNSASVKFKVRIISNVLKLEVDASDSGLVQVGEGFIQNLSAFNSFLLYYKYSASYDQGLAIDDIKIAGNFEKDNKGPILISIRVVGNNHLELVFDELVGFSSNMEFCVDAIGCSKTIDAISNSAMLEFSKEFLPGQYYDLQLPIMEDLSGNRVEKQNHIFYFPKAYDVVINEIMADPTPGILLPDAEYIELFNRSEVPINLTDWNLSVNGKSCSLPYSVIAPNNYLLLCDIDKIELFPETENKTGIGSFPAIRNSNSEVILQDNTGRLAHAVNYFDTWQESDKKEGGWSAELINPNEPCNEFANWSSSEDYRGGTPGIMNSIHSENPGDFVPDLWRVSIIGSNTIRAYFSSAMDSSRSSSAEFYQVLPGKVSPFRVSPDWPLAGSMDMEFKNNFIENTMYELIISNDPVDCGGMALRQGRAGFKYSESANAGDIVINEIMFDPHEGFSEYIELFNPSEKAIELKNWELQLNGKEPKCIMQEYFTLLPGDFALISNSMTGINSLEKFAEASILVIMPDMPALSNSGTVIRIIDSSGIEIDAVQYFPEWHHELVGNQKGVALERLSVLESGMNVENWKSAGSDINYQTPGAVNSQLDEQAGRSMLDLEPNTITPNGDGWNDILHISYSLSEPGCMGKIVIFDLEGKLVRTLANGSLIATSGEFEFEGKDESGRELSSGYYILFFEAYNEKGFRFAEKKSFVLANDK